MRFLPLATLQPDLFLHAAILFLRHPAEFLLTRLRQVLRLLLRDDFRERVIASFFLPDPLRLLRLVLDTII